MLLTTIIENAYYSHAGEDEGLDCSISPCFVLFEKVLFSFISSFKRVMFVSLQAKCRNSMIKYPLTVLIARRKKYRNRILLFAEQKADCCKNLILHIVGPLLNAH